ncbi:MAG TPA: DNA replication/repair protein RecF [Jatrophihabitantaceae bacterium]|nr:DNA replication/repair protein RecF [Jatrophihabitantaceae bacterium]
MYVRHLSVADFRSWVRADVSFEPGPATFVGANGQGKTNLIEAIGYLATLSSHRVTSDAPLIRSGTERAVVRAAVVADGRELRAEIEITAGKANRARLNGAPSRPRDVLGVLRSVLFAPEDLAIVRGDPSERRRFLDELLVVRSPRLAAVRSDYERTLKQRAALLKSAGAARRGGGGRGGELATLDVWDGHLATHGAQLLAARLDAVAALAPYASAAYAQVAPSSAPLRLRYVSSLGAELADVTGTSASTVALIEPALLAEVARMRGAELERGVNLVGPHRDDLEIGIGELPVRGYASHGESWSSALALRLGSYELLRHEGAEPVLILDDVFAELDTPRREQLAVVASSAEQVLITAAVASDVPEKLQGARYDVHDGEVRRVC